MVWCLAAFVVLPMLLLIFLAVIRVDFSGDFRQRVLGGITIWLGLMYAVVPAALFLWARQRRRKFYSQTVAVPEISAGTGKKKRLVLWLVIAMVGTACLLGLLLSDTNWSVQNITTAEVQKMVADGKGKEAKFCILQNQNGYSYFFITLRENGKRTKFTAPVDDATVAMLKEQGIKCPIYIQGRDFEVLGWPGRFLIPFCIFILVIGGVILLRKPGKFNPQEMDAQETRKMQQVERVANKVFGTGVALMLIAAAILLGCMTRWWAHTISGVEARQIIAEHNDVYCGVFQYDNGTKELWLTLRGSRHFPDFIAPADEPTLALLAKQGIAYRTVVLDRIWDFRFRGPRRWVSLLCISVLSAGAVIILWWVVRKKRTLPAPAGSRV